MTAPVIRIGMTPQELAEQLVALHADLYAASDRQTEAPRAMYVVHGERLDGFAVPPGIDALHEAWKCAVADGADLIADCTETWTIPAETPEEWMKEHHAVMHDMSLHPDRREMLCVLAASPTGSWMLVSTIDRSGDKVRLERVLSGDTSALVPDIFFSGGLPWWLGYEDDEDEEGDT